MLRERQGTLTLKRLTPVPELVQGGGSKGGVWQYWGEITWVTAA